MKLRNKKTGEIVTIGQELGDDFDGVGLMLWVDHVEGSELDDHKIYGSLAELNEEWEDYKPTEPLIEDEKIRKAVRAWAEVNDLCGATYSERPNGCAFIFEHADGDKTVICFRCTWLGLEKGKAYSITELCGGEEECSDS